MKRQTAVPPGDPDTIAWLAHAAQNRAAFTAKQLRDAQRVRVRFDVPEPVKKRLATIAADLHTSTSQLGAFTIMWFLLAYEHTDPRLDDLLNNSFRESRSIRHQCDISLDPIIRELTTSAEGPK